MFNQRDFDRAEIAYEKFLESEYQESIAKAEAESEKEDADNE